MLRCKRIPANKGTGVKRTADNMGSEDVRFRLERETAPPS